LSRRASWHLLEGFHHIAEGGAPHAICVGRKNAEKQPDMRKAVVKSLGKQKIGLLTVVM
jgi:hypothetical protein